MNAHRRTVMPGPTGTAPGAAAAPTSPAELGTILSIWAHPDDETYLAGGLMAAARDHVHGLPDGRLPDHEAEGLAWVRRLLDELAPDTILTFGPEGITFHPDHIAVHRWVTTAWEERGRSARLLRATSTVEHLDRFRALYEEWSIYMSDERPGGTPGDQVAVHVRLDGAHLDRKLTALRAMATQTGEVMAGLDPAVYAAEIAEEAFVDAARAPVARRPVSASRGVRGGA